MPVVDKRDLAMAFEFVSSSVMINEAYVSRETGKIYWVSEDVGAIDDEENPEDLDDSKKYIPVPDKRDLDLGTSLAFDFAKRRLPERYDEVRDIFRRRGAYGRLKELLDGEDLLEKWYAYCESRESAAIAEWCKENGIELSSQG